MEDYIKKQRFTSIDRERAGITSHRVIEVRENDLTIGVPLVLSRDGCISIPMSDTSEIKPGMCLDFRFSYTISNGRANSYQTRYLGETPSKFAPKDGETYTK